MQHAPQGIEIVMLSKLSKHSTASRALNFFLRAGNNPVVLKDNTEHAETLFIALLVRLTLVSKNYFNRMFYLRFEISTL